MVRHQKSWLGFIRICALTPPTFTRCFCVNSASYPIKKFSKISREMAAVWNFWCNFRKDLALHCEQVPLFAKICPTFKKMRMGFWGMTFFFELKPRTSFLRTSSHYVHLELYYSVDFPWWFDRKICRHFSFQASNKKLVKWQKFKTALCNLTKKPFRRISYLYKSTLVLKKKLSALKFNVPIQDVSIGEASAADISYYYYYILLTCIITQPILAHPPIKLPTQLGPLPLLITEKNIPFRINKTKTLIHS